MVTANCRWNILLLVVLFAIPSTLYAAQFDKPRIAIIVSKTSFEKNWETVQMAAHAWAAITNLAGIPYDTLTLSEVIESDNLEQYRALIIIQCPHISEMEYANLHTTLKKYYSSGGNFIIDGPFGIYNEKGLRRDRQELGEIIGFEHAGFRGDTTHRITVTNNKHYITRNVQTDQFLTSTLASALNTLAPKHGGSVLLSSNSANQSYPFLSVIESKNNRIVLVSDSATYSKVSTVFSNEQSRGFYPNHVYEVLIRSIYWAIYGDLSNPFPVAQLSNADMTAIARLDADDSDVLIEQLRAIEYLVRLADETGIVSVYGLVSSWVPEADWAALSFLGEKLEETGGRISTHTHSHFFNRDVSAQLAKEEFDTSVQSLERHMHDYGRYVGTVDVLINPNITIKMDSYSQIADRFSLFMTHGFERTIPFGYGNLTWFTEGKNNLAVVNSTPMPDFQWFYDSAWNYSAAQIAQYEEAIFDHLYTEVGRAVVFNQMWHDYTINSRYDRPFFDFDRIFKNRIVNDDNLPMFEAMKKKFSSHPIYFPDATDLANKLMAMAQWNYSWSSKKNQLDFTIDLSQVESKNIHEFIGGMGIRVENTKDVIQKVFINRKPHYAFREQVVILPNLALKENLITVILGPDRPKETHLSFISKRMPLIEKTIHGLETTVLTKSKAKFSFEIQADSILLNADWQQLRLKRDAVLDGYVTTDRRLILQEMRNEKIMVSKATVPIIRIEKVANSLTFILGKKDQLEESIWFRSLRKPRNVTLNGIPLIYTKDLKDYKVTLPDFREGAKIKITF